jgi:hypothetical protein
MIFFVQCSSDFQKLLSGEETGFCEGGQEIKDQGTKEEEAIKEEEVDVEVG